MVGKPKRNQEGSFYSCHPKTEELNNTNTGVTQYLTEGQGWFFVLHSYHFWILKAAKCL